MYGRAFQTLLFFVGLARSLSSFDVSLIQGRWYQMYTSLVAKETYHANTFCNTVDYYNLTMTSRSVFFNAAHTNTMGSPQGALQRTGLALSNDDPERFPGRFQCVYTDALLKVETSLWVKAFGAPEGKSTLYPWVFLSSPNQIHVQILTRDPKSFQDKFKDDVLNVAKAMDYVGEFTRPIYIDHSDLCNYINLTA